MTTYLELERQMLHDLATRTVSDPAAPEEHVAEASRRLSGERPEPLRMLERAKQRLKPHELRELRRLLHKVAD